MDLSKSLEELNKEKLLKPDFDSSLAKKCHHLWSVPLSELSVENLRMLIGQKIGLDFLVPLALDILAMNPLAEGGMYKGDLLANIAALPDSFWLRYPELNNQLVEIKNELEIISATIDELTLVLSSRTYLTD